MMHYYNHYTQKILRYTLMISVLFAGTQNISANEISAAIAHLSTFQDDCDGISEWSSSSVYTGGNLVRLNDVRYRAKWWSQGDNPASNSTQYAVWEVLGACDGGNGGDNVSPTVSLTAPANNAVFEDGSSINLTANASDTDGSISLVEFFNNGQKLGEDNSSPYSFTINNAQSGSYVLTARAVDNAGAATTSGTITVSVEGGGNNGGDCDGATSFVVGSTYGQDDVVSNDGNTYRCDIPGWCSSTAGWAYAPGTGLYWQDAWTQTGTCDDTGGDDNAAPSVSISSPSNGARFDQGANISITASATDNDGSISKVAFFNNGNLISEDTSAPFTATISNASAGNFSLTADATDNDGAVTTSAQVNITVNGVVVNPPNPNNGDLPNRILVGYWHNFNNGSSIPKLRDISTDWDVVNISFAIPTVPGGSNMVFEPDNAIYGSVQEFKNDVRLLQDRGVKVLISMGGATGAVDVVNSADATQFATSMTGIINEYGFDGMDIDFEGSSLILGQGDSDFRNPVGDKVVNLITAFRSILNQFDDSFILSMAPETAYVQGGFSTYGGIFGAYLPVIHALRDQLDYIHVQHYNTGSMLGLDSQVYAQGNADFHVAMAELLLQGFPVNGIQFPGLPADKVAIGLPSTAAAAPAGGFTSVQEVQRAMDYIIKGQSFGGNYQLRQAGGYPNFRGLMTWSINWDVVGNFGFSRPHRQYLDRLDAATAAAIAESPAANFDLAVYPNPFTASTSLSFELSKNSFVSAVVLDQNGTFVTEIESSELSAGRHDITWDGSTAPVGIYFIQVSIDGQTETFKVLKN